LSFDITPPLNVGGVRGGAELVIINTNHLAFDTEKEKTPNTLLLGVVLI